MQDIDRLVNMLKSEPGYDHGLELARRIVALLGASMSDTEAFLQDQKVIQHEGWFLKHPVLTSQRACVSLNVDPDAHVQAKFYCLGKDAKKSMRQRIMAAVHFTPNYEDAEFTRQQKLPIGIDFFLHPDGDAMTIALSNRGLVRVLTLEGHLTNTAKTILSNWSDMSGIFEQERLHSALWDSFQLQEVNKKFYKEIARFFTDLTQHLVSKNIFENDDAKQYTNRLIGRLLFVWFLRKKGVINESENYFAVTTNSDAYYQEHLRKLFFATLNTPIDERKDQKTPYLNGGLFDESELDQNDAISFPTGYFANIFHFFDEYNFTTDESTPDFEQVAIDPEMLGRIFENLLAEQVDETKVNARKASGAFYTPREIVDYMCRESLRQYLYTQLDGKVLDHTIVVDKLIDTSEQEWANDESNQTKHLFEKRPADRDEVRRALERLKVLDPACGSGAFPMGMMQLLVRIFQRIDRKLDEYEVKLGIMQSTIYGVDINPMAADISRLRAWLSLVVDEVPEKLRNEPLPNLDFKFITANSLIPLAEGDSLDIFGENNLGDKLADLRDKYFRARSKESKQKLRQEYRSLTAQVGLSSSQRSKQLQSFDPFDSTKCAQFFDIDYMFGVNGFDIVIGNPPYGVKLSKSEKEFYKSVYKSARSTKDKKGSTDTYSLFIDLGLFHAIKTNGILSYIVPLTITSGDSMSVLHHQMLESCETIKISSYCDRPVQIFKNAHKKLSIVQLLKTSTGTKNLLMTKMYRLQSDATLQELMGKLEFINVLDTKMFDGRLPKISKDIEKDILNKIFKYDNLGAMANKHNDGSVYYRSAGGMYFNVITNYANNLSSEKEIKVNSILVNPIAAILSSSLFWWYQQVYTDCLNLKLSEIESFPVPNLEDNASTDMLGELYRLYAEDIEKNVSIIESEAYKNITSFKEYKIRNSINLIDEIDDVVCTMYGLNSAEIDFIKNYEKSLRVDEDR